MNNFKVLTIKQPWAYLIAAGLKDIENRTWKCPEKYIGQRILIHASAKPISSGNCISHLLNENQYRLVTFKAPTKQPLDICFLKHYNSAIIGSVEIVDCVINHPSIWAEKTNLPEQLSNECIWNWVLANPILFDEPILGVKGKLGFWNYEFNK